jgi:hypothetical protein
MSTPSEYIEQANNAMAETAAAGRARLASMVANSNQQAQTRLQSKLAVPKPGSFGSLGAITGRTGGAYYPGE